MAKRRSKQKAKGKTRAGALAKGRGWETRTCRAYPVTFRLKVVEQVERGVSVSEVARVFGPMEHTIRGWLAAYRKGGVDALVPKPLVPPTRKPKAGAAVKLAAALAMVACSPPGAQSSQAVASPVTTPACGPDPVVEGFVLAETIRCAWGVASQCGFAGAAYKHGLGVGRDLRRAREYFSRACELGSQDDCVEFGLMMLKLGEKGRYPEVIPMWERACEKGSLAGCHAAGWGWALNAAELGVATDVARGRAFLSKTCAAGYMLSCGVEALLVVQTKDTASYATAQVGLIKACDLRERESCHFLAQTELHGTFGPKDETAAAGHFWEACRFGWGAGCGALAYLNAVGIGVPKDSDKARKLAEVTCKELHYEPACKAAQTSDFAPLAPEVP